jgi:hypothetical protein
MKVSKIIFISLLGTIALLILSAGLDIRINGISRKDKQFVSKVIKQSIPSFKVLIISNNIRKGNNRNITLVQGDSAYIEAYYPKDSLAPKINYTINNDTLKVLNFTMDINRNAWLKICCTGSLKGFYVTNADVDMRSFISNDNSVKLTLNLDHSRVNLFQENSAKASVLSSLNIFAKNQSSFYTSNLKVDSINIILQNSQADLRISINKLKGSVSEKSRMNTRQPLEIALVRDSDSKIYVTN